MHQPVNTFFIFQSAAAILPPASLPPCPSASLPRCQSASRPASLTSVSLCIQPLTESLSLSAPLSLCQCAFASPRLSFVYLSVHLTSQPLPLVIHSRPSSPLLASQVRPPSVSFDFGFFLLT
ncbi:hypothetical protein S83_050876 [Arachis hypogaea]